MKTSDDDRVARNAWQLWKSITLLDTMLWELFCDQFLDFDEEEEHCREETRFSGF